MKIPGPVGRKKKKKVSFAPLVENSASYDDLCGYVGLMPASKSTADNGNSSNAVAIFNESNPSTEVAIPKPSTISTAVVIPKPSIPSNHKMVPRYFHDEEPRSVPKPLKPRRIFDESTVDEIVSASQKNDDGGKNVDPTVGFSKVI